MTTPCTSTVTIAKLTYPWNQVNTYPSTSHATPPTQCHKSFQQALEKLGGSEVLAEMLRSDVTHGLPSDDDLEDRASEFGRNWMPVPDPKTWVQLFIDSFDDTTLIILIVSAIVSLAVSLPGL